MKYIFKTALAIIFCFYMSALNAAKITTTSPTITISNLDGSNPVTIQADNNAIFSDAFIAASNGAQDSLSKYTNQTELARGFANANAYASRAATQQGYQDYDLFAITTGFMIGVQTPSTDPAYYNKISDDIKDDGDTYAGIGTGVAFFNAGINSKFFCPGLYLNVAFGKYTVDQFKSSNFLAKCTLFELGANYTWIQSRSILLKLIKWRGVSFGSGLYYNKTDIDLNIKMDPSTDTETIGSI